MPIKIAKESVVNEFGDAENGIDDVIGKRKILSNHIPNWMERVKACDCADYESAD